MFSHYSLYRRVSCLLRESRFRGKASTPAASNARWVKQKECYSFKYLGGGGNLSHKSFVWRSEEVGYTFPLVWRPTLYNLYIVHQIILKLIKTETYFLSHKTAVIFKSKLLNMAILLYRYRYRYKCFGIH